MNLIYNYCVLLCANAYLHFGFGSKIAINTPVLEQLVTSVDNVKDGVNDCHEKSRHVNDVTARHRERLRRHRYNTLVFTS